MGLSGIGGTLVLGDGRTVQEGVHPPPSGCHQSSSSFIHLFHIYLVPDPGQVQSSRQINQIPTLKALSSLHSNRRDINSQTTRLTEPRAGGKDHTWGIKEAARREWLAEW